MATRSTKTAAPRRRATTDTKHAGGGREAAPPNGEAEPLARTLEQRLVQVVDLVEMLAQTRASGAGDERLVQLERRVMELGEASNQPTVTVDAVVAPPPVPGSYLTMEQQQLALTYDAFRTSLGRVGAASIVLYRVVEDVEDEEDTVGVCITSGHVDDGSQIVVYGRSARRGDGQWGELGRARFAGYDCPTLIKTSDPEAQIDRLEVLDRSGRPVRLGFQLPPEPDRVF
jgi:hypothetical protein